MAVGSGVERFLDTEEVIGSNPIPPISIQNNKFLIHAGKELFVFALKRAEVESHVTHREKHNGYFYQHKTSDD